MAPWSASRRSCANGCASRSAVSGSPVRRSSTRRASRPPRRAASGATTGGKKVLGRKRHLLVDTTGLILRIHVHPADEQDRDSGLDLLVGADREFPCIEQLWADGAYQGEFEDWVETTLGWRVTIVSAQPEQVGFAVQPRRWVVERSFAHLGRYRRLAKDFEHLVECVVAHIFTASIHIMLKRLAAAA